jgi:uncharacterized membrane protein
MNAAFRRVGYPREPHAVLIGTIGVTRAFNVPRNNALAKLDPEAHDPQQWRSSLAKWTGWDHVQTVAPLVAVTRWR